MSKLTKVLLVLANPAGTDMLALGREERIIREAIQLSKYRDNINLHTLPAATITDIRRALLNENYRIVHISGHGTLSGLILEDEQGSRAVVKQTALASLFQDKGKARKDLECILLNACYSIEQGSLISLSTPYTIGMEGPIADKAAIEFSRGFYDAIGANEEIDIAFDEGCRSVASAAAGARFVAKIIRKGETGQPDNYFTNQPARIFTDEKPGNNANRSLIGIAVDVSGSMASSIKNDSNKQLTRLESFGEAFNKLGARAKEIIRSNSGNRTNSTAEVFAYAFGLRFKNVCDLLSLMKLGKDIISEQEIESIKQGYINEMRRKYAPYSGLIDIAKEYGFSQVLEKAGEFASQSAEAEIRRRVMMEIARRFDISLHAIGDTTLLIDEMVALSEVSSTALTNAEELIFGDTPMAEAFSVIKKRFQQELSKRPKDTIPVLFVISDGVSTDNDPLPIAEEIKKANITIITCYITNKDIMHPKTLIGQRSYFEEKGAALMFDIASNIDENSIWTNFLLQKGWTIQKGAKYFVQINHSSILEEFINVVLTPLDNQTTPILPKGF